MFGYGLIESLGHHDECRCGCRVFVVDSNSSLAKRVTWLVSLIILLVISLTLFAGICTAVIHPDGEGSASVVACSLNCDRYTISPGGANYDEATDSTDFSYTVSVGNGTCGMQNWLLFAGGCLNATDILSAGPVPWEFIGIEDQTGMQAIKFDTGIESPDAGKPDRSRIYSLKLAGNWSGKTAPVEAAIVTSGGRCLQNVIGPSC
ncbi:MAG: hypothetical protein M0Q43_08930 [Methanothrix sp.]|jgi:hypothetical protein|nr:hypothetical protein [Methanothrix sp.]